MKKYATQTDIYDLLKKIDDLCILSKKIKEERDELLAALKEITAWYWPNVSGKARDEMPKYKEIVKKYDHA